MTLSVSIQPRDGGWITLGTQQDGGHGGQPEQLKITGDLNEYGCLSCTFRITANPKWIRHHLEQFTPVVVKHGDTNVWSGRIITTPLTIGEQEQTVMVECQGWGQHLKDDCTDREWVIIDLSRWVDARQTSFVDLGTRHSITPQVVIDGNGITFSLGANGVARSNRSMGMVLLDLGPNNLARRIVLTYTSSNNTGASALLFASSSATGDWPTRSDAISGHTIAAGTTLAGTFSTTNEGRYVLIFPYWNTGDATFSADWWLRITDVQVYTDASDESGNASALKASTIIGEALDACAPLIDPDRSKIATTSTNFPAFPGGPGYRYTNELIDQANQIHGYVARLSPDPSPVFEFTPQPTDYTLEVGAGEYTFEEPGANDGRAVYTRVISEYEDASGVRAAASSSDSTYLISPTQLPNSGFDVDTSGWTAGGGTVTRDTGVANTGVASARLTGNGSNTFVAISTTSNLQLLPNTKYQLRFAFRRANTIAAKSGTAYSGITPRSQGSNILVPDAALFAIGTAMAAQATGSFVTYTVDFTTLADGQVSFQAGLANGGSAVDFGYFDTIEIYQPGSSVAARRGFQRTALRPAGIRTSSTTAQALADLERANSAFPPFRGKIKIPGPIRLKGGGSIHPCEAVAMVGDAILIKDQHDPNTGALGRIGTIYATSWDETDGGVIIEYDRADRFIQQLRARLALGTA